MVPRTADPTRDGHVRLFVAAGPSGRPVFEDVPAQQQSPGVWTLRATPGLATGAAAGDKVKVGADGTFEVLSRAGNVALHVSAPAGEQAALDRLTQQLERIGGWLDGRSWTRDGGSSFSVFTVPVQAGFPSIEGALGEFVAAVPKGEWYYVNVYDPADDTTPLNWWADG